ncbi:MAG: hydroxylamine reductase, partial [Desulfobacterales bacterium]|nr:hydroxylamine reductase [Desulfobacterales bacterium]
MKDEMTRRSFIKAGAVTVAATALCPSILGSTNAFGLTPEGNKMFCYQCEQTANGTGCTTIGICGKTSSVAALQDMLVYSLKGLALYAVAARQKGIEDKEVNRFIPSAMFATLTNVDFDPERLHSLVHRTVAFREQLKKRVDSAGGSIQFADRSSDFIPALGTNKLIAQGRKVGLKSDPSIDPDLLSLQHTLIFGLKGLSAYAHHARDLGQEDSKVYHFVQDGLVATINKNLGMNDLLGIVLKCGEVNLRAMELLDAGNTERYGHPVPTKVPLGVRKGKAILVSGHDLIDLEQILIQSEGKGINVYTHGEMLPTHGYPKLKERYPHFYGHYGTAWQNQKQEFKNFPGAILMTTNCIQKPQAAYQENIFTTGLVGWPGVPHVHNADFS